MPREWSWCSIARRSIAWVTRSSPGTRSPRTFLDLDGVDLGGVTRDTPAEGIVTRVRAEATSTGSRVSLDLDGPALAARLLLARAVSHRRRRRAAPARREGRSARTVARVVLDPGHGGKDTGAVGPTGVKEKDVTLDVAHRVAPVLAAQGHAGGSHARRRPLRLARGADGPRERLQRGPLRVASTATRARAVGGAASRPTCSTRRATRSRARVAARENATTPGRERGAGVDPRRDADGRRGAALDALRAAARAGGD